MYYTIGPIGAAWLICMCTLRMVGHPCMRNIHTLAKFISIVLKLWQPTTKAMLLSVIQACAKYPVTMLPGMHAACTAPSHHYCLLKARSLYFVIATATQVLYSYIDLPVAIIIPLSVLRLQVSISLIICWLLCNCKRVANRHRPCSYHSQSKTLSGLWSPDGPGEWLHGIDLAGCQRPGQPDLCRKVDIRLVHMHHLETTFTTFAEFLTS